MSLESFMSLSVAFRNSTTPTDCNMFLGKRIEQEYFRLGVDDRLRIHSVIDRRDHFDNPHENLKKATLEQRLDVFEVLYRLKLALDCDKLVRNINSSAPALMTPYSRATLEGRIPLFIAMDLADVIQKSPDAAHLIPDNRKPPALTLSS